MTLMGQGYPSQLIEPDDNGMDSHTNGNLLQSFAALSTRRRFEIMKALRSGPLTVSKLIERLGGAISQRSMLGSLVILESAGLAYRRRSNWTDLWCLNKQSVSDAIACLAEFNDAISLAAQEPPAGTFPGPISRILENKRLLLNEKRKKILSEIVLRPAQVASLYERLERTISKRYIFSALSAFESEGLVLGRKTSVKGKALEFTATDFAREVLDCVRGNVTAGSGV